MGHRGVSMETELKDEDGTRGTAEHKTSRGKGRLEREKSPGRGHRNGDIQDLVEVMLKEKKEELILKSWAIVRLQ